MQAARKRPELASVFTTMLAAVPQVYINVERDKVLTQGVNLSDVYKTLQSFMGGALINYFNRLGREFTMRYNLYRCSQINASAATGYSSAQAMAALEEVFAQTMPPDMGFDYLGMSYQEQRARQGVPPSVIFGFSTLFCFLILAALYESWTLPFSVLISVPIAVFGAFFALYIRRLTSFSFENNVYAQIGLIMLI